MKILYHHRTMARGAEGTHILSIAKGFGKLGHEVVFVCPPGIQTSAVAGEKPLDKSEVKTIGISSFWKMLSKDAPQFVFEISELFYNLYAFIGLCRTMNRYGCSLIYERYANFLMAGALVSRIYKVPLFLEVNEVVGVTRARSIFFERIARLIERYVLARATVSFPVSSNLRKRILAVNPDAESVVIPNAIDPARFSAVAHAGAILPDVKGRTVLGFVGWFDRWDRLDLLIDLQKRLLAGNHDTVLLLIGDGPVLTELRQKLELERLDEHVILTGPVPKNEVPGYIAAFDIGVLAHSNDFGSPIALFEMMALGKCVVAPRLDPIVDVIVDGINGVIFEPLDLEDLYRKTARLVADGAERARIGQAARAAIYERHIWDKNAEVILSQLPLKPDSIGGRS